MAKDRQMKSRSELNQVNKAISLSGDSLLPFVSADSGLLSALLAHVPAAVALFDHDMRYVACSRRWLTDYRITDQPILGRSHYDIFPEISDARRAIHRRVLAGESLSDKVEPFTRGDGSIDWVRWEMVPWRSGSGEIGGAMLCSETLTELVDSRQRALSLDSELNRLIISAQEQVRAAEESAALVSAILETVPDALVAIDENGVIALFSKAAERLYGYGADEVVGQNVALLMTQDFEENRAAFLASFDPTVRGDSARPSRRALGKRKDGSLFPHEYFVGEARAMPGGRRIFTGFVRDLSAREEADAQLRDLQAELIEISRVSAVGTMATALTHELNQPLTAVANYVQTSAALISAGADDMLDLIREALEEAGREVLRAGAIVNRLRQFAAPGALDRVIVSPRELAVQTCALSAFGGRLCDITCHVAIPEDTGPILVDRAHIQKVLLNLIRNAIEAIGDSGAITIDAQPDCDMLRFTVQDTGRGIVAGQEEDLFEPFVSSRAAGMGLGLAVCRSIIEAHGGRMWCEARPEGGAAFHFTLPVAELGNT